MITEARLILPVNDNNGISLVFVHKALKRLLCQNFGGYTASATNGGWLSPSGHLYEEPGTAYDVALADTEENRAKLVEVAEWLANSADQEAIYCRLPNGSVQFVERAPLEVAV